MNVTLEIPEELAQRLGPEAARMSREALGVEALRQGLWAEAESWAGSYGSSAWLWISSSKIAALPWPTTGTISNASAERTTLGPKSEWSLSRIRAR